MATPFCTLADLQLAQTDYKLRELLSDALANTSIVWSTDPLFWADSGVLAVVAAVITDASSTVDDYLAGRVDSTDSATADALRRYAVAFALAALWRRQGHDAAGNPWIREADSARSRLKELRKGELSAGASEQPQLLCESTTADVPPTYARDADGNESTLGEKLVMAGAGVVLNAETVGWPELQAAIVNARNLTMRPLGLMQAIGQRVMQQTKRRFQTTTAPDGTRWAPKLPLFVQLEGGKSAPLTYTGGLMRSIVHQEPDDSTTQIGSALPYAARHQFGGKGSKPAPFFVQVAEGQDWREGKLVLKQTEGARMVFMNIDVRPRPYLGLSDDDRVSILVTVEEYLSKNFLAPLRGKGGN